jgi:hypothetical protein
MTEAEWLACTEPQKMLTYLCRKRHGREALKRKLTLFACACCRRIWPLFPTEACRDVIQLAEWHADGLATEDECDSARVTAYFSAEDGAVRCSDWYRELSDPERLPGVFAFRAATGLVSPAMTVAEIAGDAAREVANEAVHIQIMGSGPAEANELDIYVNTLAQEQVAQALLLREIFGNPFCPIPFSKAWRTRDVQSIARVVYENPQMPRGTLDPTQLAILADALADAGYDNDFLLSHLREPGPHVCGCWVVDHVLGKE